MDHDAIAPMNAVTLQPRGQVLTEAHQFMGQSWEAGLDDDVPGDIKRKYLAEAGLVLYSDGPVMFRPSDIYRLGKDPGFREALRGTNIYLICRRRRISVDPLSLKIKGGDLYGDFLVHGEGYQEWEPVPFVLTPM